MTPELDDDAINAAIDLIGRTGATELEFGYLNEDAPVHLADWYAHAKYRGGCITVEHRSGPLEAIEALARRLLVGGQCTHCRKRITLTGTAGKKQCRWTRQGSKWVRGCT